jgi:hypothetical protein
MTMAESIELLTMRAMAWERAKGELSSYLETFWPQYNAVSGKILDNGFDEASKKIEAFISDFEINCR